MINTPQKIIDRIKSEEQTEVTAIQREAEEKVDEVRSATEAQAVQMEKELLEKARYDASMEKQRILANARLQAKRIITNVRESMIASCLQQVRERMEKFPSEKNYDAVLKKLIRVTVQALGTKEILILLREEDKTLPDSAFLETVEKETGVRCILSEKSRSIIGGVVIQTIDEKVEVDHSFESLFENKLPHLRAQAAELLFSN